ncbi:hypothetical protein [Litchfieldia salsa]|uniref:Uncharacterized protein n=1 Tax=Litchfieldia salsa TaxID=930152 RepID=A0A1H0QB74_9BACI|nr:hypothetical protein [Litchfieldia salsa]SDP14621.1 hypothetical protein SAMN05216565_101685 [Litchfieldia salsa]
MKRLFIIALLGLGLVGASIDSTDNYAHGGGAEHPDPLVVSEEV